MTFGKQVKYKFNVFLSLWQTEEDFFANLSGEPRDDIIHRDEEDEESEEGDDDEEEKEEIRPVRERKVNSREGVVEKSISVGSMAQSLQREGACQ